MMKEKINQLKLIFEDGEEIVSGLKKGLKENNLEYVLLTGAEGKIRDFEINYFLGSEYRGKHIEREYSLNSASGKFARKGEDFTGDFHVLIFGEGTETLNGTIISAIASGEVIITARIPDFKKMIGDD